MDYLKIAQQLADFVVWKDKEGKMDYQMSYTHLFSFALGMIIGSSTNPDKVKELLEETKPVKAKE